MSTTHIVIVGGGIAGVPLAYALKADLGERVDVTVVSNHPWFHFVPANPWLALGLRHENEVCFELAPLLASRGIGLRTQAVGTIHPNDNNLTLADGTNLGYDYLVLATGICPDWARVPGARPGVGVHSVILPRDAAAARRAYLDFLKQPGPVVVAAAAGASILGPMYEYAFLMDADLRRRGMRTRTPISVITPEPYPGHLGLDKPVVSDALKNALKKHDIGWIGNAELQSCHDRRLRFVTYGDAGGEHSIAFAYAMVWPPFRGVEAVLRCSALGDEHGLIAVDDYQRSPAYDNIFALGACTAKPALTHTPVPIGVPDAVYAVQQQVTAVSRNIVRSLNGEALVSANIEREHWIEDMGKRGAAYLSAPQMPLRNINWLRRGRWVFDAKREFENYFINQILLGAGEHGHVAALVRRLRSCGRGRRSDAESKSAAPEHNVIISTDLRRELDILARHLGVSSEDLSRQLLESAMAEARSYLDPDTSRRITAEIRTQRIDEIQAEQERVRFEGGAP